jgi:Protein of unknown function (DUF2975)
MKNKLSDPLLAAVQIGMVMLGIGIAALLTVGRGEVLAELAKTGAPPVGFWLIPLAMLAGMGLLYLANKFVSELGGIVNSVGDGDPFMPENANRLSRMGWISVIAQVAVLPLAALAAWFAPYADKADAHIDIDGGLDGGSILLTLILFVLARVFREGTRMRDELEGTI